MIGCGNMAQAMIGGMVESGVVDAADIFVSNPIQEQLEVVKTKYGVPVTNDNKEVSRWADYLIIAVKPNIMNMVLKEVKDHLEPEKTVLVSIAAGVDLAQMERQIDIPNIKLLRVMPNTPALVGEGMTAITGNENVGEKELNAVLEIFDCFGKTKVIPEELFHGVTATSGSSPAMVYILIEAMADAAVKAGLKREDAYELAAQSVLGSAKMVVETKLHPGVLKDRVCSPGGTTIAMVEELDRKGFRGAVLSALDAAVHKSIEMSSKEQE